MRAQCFKGYSENCKKFCVLSDVRADIKMFLLFFFFSEKDGQFRTQSANSRYLRRGMITATR